MNNAGMDGYSSYPDEEWTHTVHYRDGLIDENRFSGPGEARGYALGQNEMNTDGAQYDIVKIVEKASDSIAWEI